ncbi:MAG TPA: hypothetical protein VEV87_05455 [Chitinophagaceae bacterium]|nr:hypothetical protein [Chitinophagaceae bacterium]
MKKSSLVMVLVLTVFVLKAQFNASKDPFITKSLAGETIKNVEVETSGGSIDVQGGTGNYRLEVFVWPNNLKKGDNISKEELQKRLDEHYDLKIAVVNNKLTAIAKQKKNNMDWKKAVSVSFKVYVQQNVNTDLATSGGSISLSNLTGSQEFTTSGGSLHVENLTGKIEGHTSGGSIHLEGSKDDIELTTSGGSIEARNCTGKIKLATSGGSLTLSGLKGNIRATTSGGSVNGSNIEGDLIAHTSGGNINLEKINSSLETSTSGGNINVEVVTLKGFIKIHNSGGNINLSVPNKSMDLNLTGGRIKTDKLTNFSGSIEEESVKGKLNGGGVPVTVNAGSGRITLSVN